MGLSREHVVQLVNDTYGWRDTDPDSLERMDAYDRAMGLIRDYEEARAEEIDAASRAADAADELIELGINVDTDLV